MIDSDLSVAEDVREFGVVKVSGKFSELAFERNAFKEGNLL